MFVRLRISPSRIKLAASNFAQWFIGLLGTESHILENFALPEAFPEAQNWTNGPAYGPCAWSCTASWPIPAHTKLQKNVIVCNFSIFGSRTEMLCFLISFCLVISWLSAAMLRCELDCQLNQPTLQHCYWMMCCMTHSCQWLWYLITN